MTRVWSMASERTDTQDCAQFDEAIIYVCVGQQSPPPAPPPLPPPLPPDNDSGYEASPSSATRLTTFQFGSVSDTAQDSALEEELLSFDVFLAPIMLYENEEMIGNDEMSADETDDNNEVEDNEMRAESRNSGGSYGSNSSDRLISTPIPIPTPTQRIIRSNHENSFRQISHLRSTERSNVSPLTLSQSYTSFGVNDFDGRRFGRRNSFGINHWNRYNTGMTAISPESPPSSTYWSPYIMGIVSPVGQRSHHNNHNHYMGFHESVTSAQSSLSYAQDIRLPSPLSSLSFSSQMSGRVAAASHPLNESQNTNANNNNHNNNNHNNTNNQPLPDVVNIEPRRIRMANGHSHARRPVSVSLPIDEQTIRSVGISLRRISEEFEISNSRMIVSNSEPGSHGMVGNIFASVRLSRRSLSSRFGSHHINLNGRQRSFSTNDAPEE